MMEPIKILFAKQLRASRTKEEHKVWQIIRNRKMLGLKFRRQHVIEGFVVDFYCIEHRLALEIDGPIHDKHKEYDQLRQALIESKDIKVLRIPNDKVNQKKHLLKQLLELKISPLLKSNSVPLSQRS